MDKTHAVSIDFLPTVTEKANKRTFLRIYKIPHQAFGKGLIRILILVDKKDGKTRGRGFSEISGIPVARPSISERHRDVIGSPYRSRADVPSRNQHTAH